MSLLFNFTSPRLFELCRHKEYKSDFFQNQYLIQRAEDGNDESFTHKKIDRYRIEPNLRTTVILNFAKFWDSHNLYEVNLKLKTKLVALQLKMLQDKRKEQWNPQIDFKTSQTIFDSEFVRNTTPTHCIPQIYGSISAKNQRVALMSKYKFNDNLNVSLFGSLQSSEDVQNSMKKSTIFGHELFGAYGIDLNLKI